MKCTCHSRGCSPLKELSSRHKRGLIAACVVFASYPVFGEELIEPMELRDARRAGQIHVTAFERVTEGAPSEVSACRDWKLTREDAKHFFTQAELLDSTEWHHTFDIMPCGYSGSLLIGNLYYQFSINAGGWGAIQFSSDSTDHVLYSCKPNCGAMFRERSNGSSESDKRSHDIESE